jgi:chromosome segregation ATPase
MESWRDQVLIRGKQYLEKWATAHGISRQQFEVANLLRQLSAADSRLSQLRPIHSELSMAITELKKVSTTAAGEDVEGFDDLNERRDELERISNEIGTLERERRTTAVALKRVEPDATELLDSNPQELETWADTYLPNSPEALRFTQLVSTHADWESRFGRINDFEAALIASSQVVAGI